RDGFLQQSVRGGIGDAEVRAEAEGRAEHHRDALGIEQFGTEGFVAVDDPSGVGLLADQLRAGRIDIEGALRRRAGDAARLVEHRDDKIAPALEDRLVLRDEIQAMTTDTPTRTPMQRHMQFALSACIAIPALVIALISGVPLAFSISIGANVFFATFIAGVIAKMPQLSGRYLSKNAREIDLPVLGIFAVTLAVVGVAIV